MLAELSPAWLPPTKPIAVMPAATPAATPTGESSTTMHSRGSTRILPATCRNRSGAGLPLRHVACREQIRLEETHQAGGSRLTRMRSCDEEDATHFGPRSQVSA